MVRNTVQGRTSARGTILRVRFVNFPKEEEAYLQGTLKPTHPFNVNGWLGGARSISS